MSMTQGLAADIGGTNTRLALVENGLVCENTVARYKNSDFATPEDAIKNYLANIGQPVCKSVVLAIAAPIDGETIRMTNHPWTFNTPCISRILGGADVKLLNDFEALAHSVDQIDPSRLKSILAPETQMPGTATRLVVGAGTGFNAASLINASGTTFVGTGECGHSTLPIESDRELNLWNYLARNRGRASIERALSGNGLREIYEWQCLETGQPVEPYAPADITRLANEGIDQACVATARQWVTLLGRVIGDLALIFLARGGIVLAGGVTRSLSRYLNEPEFRTAFSSKGRQSQLVSSIPVDLLDDDFAALSGCAAFM